MLRYILIILIVLLICSTTCGQDINIYNGYGYGYGAPRYSGYSYAQPRRHVITPYYGGYYNPGPWYLYGRTGAAQARTYCDLVC